MTKRPAEWHLLDLDSDPVPADAHDVHLVAKDFHDRGQVMSQAASTLKQFSDLEGWKGLAAIEFADKAEEAHGDLQKASTKYTDAGSAIETYSSAVTTARDDTWTAVKNAEDADNRRRANATSSLPDSGEPTDDQKDADDRRKTRLSTANSDLTAAKTALHEAMSALESAARTCAKAIRSASGHFKDSKWDDIKGVVSAVIKVLVDALQIIAIIVAVIIIVLLVIGSGGAFLAFLVAASFWLGVAIFALTAVQVAMGDATGKDLAWASLGLLGGGITKAAGSLVRGGLTSVRGAMALRAANNARQSLPAFIKFIQKVPFLRVAGDFVEARRVTAAVKALDDSLAAVQTAGKNPLLRGLELKGMVNNMNTIKAMRGMDVTPAELAQLSQLSKTNLTGFLTGQGLIDLALGHDIAGSPGQVADSIDFLKDPSSVLDSLGTRSTPAGR